MTESELHFEKQAGCYFGLDRGAQGQKEGEHLVRDGGPDQGGSKRMRELLLKGNREHWGTEQRHRGGGEGHVKGVCSVSGSQQRTTRAH